MTPETLFTLEKLNARGVGTFGRQGLDDRLAGLGSERESFIIRLLDYCFSQLSRTSMNFGEQR